MKLKVTFAFLLALVVVFAAVVPVLADDVPGNSEPGLARYLSNPGNAGDVGAQCDTGAGSATKGYLGKDKNMAGGANGTATGDNNSAVCGQGHGN